jgi:RNA polymerase sigma-70 factor (ECF subfamily)
MWPEIKPSGQKLVPAHLRVFGGPTDQLPAFERNSSTDHNRCSLEALLRRLHEGDCELFYELTKGFLPNVYAFVRSMVHDASMADDICQHTFLIAVQKVHQLRELRCLRSWVMQIAVNQVRMNWRSSQRHLTVALDAFEDSEQPSLQPATLIDARKTPFEAVAHKELKRILEEALQQLAPKYRSVFWLRDVEQFSGAEAAAILGISVNCVKARLLRARLKLRDHLAPILGMEATPKLRWKRIDKTTALRDRSVFAAVAGY